MTATGSEPPTLDVAVYSRPGCRLCEVAYSDIRTLMVQSGFDSATVRLVNIEDHPDLETAYGTEIPVVSINGGAGTPYRGDPGTLLRALEEL